VNTVKDLREALSEEMRRLQAPAGLEARVLQQTFRSPAAAKAAPGARRRTAVRWWESRSVEIPRLMALVAAVLAVAIVVSLLFAAHALHSKSIFPAHPAPLPSPQLPSSARCVGYEPAFSGVVPVKAVDANTVWGTGGLLSRDGGAHWRDESPVALRPDEPTGLPKMELPPGFADFYLDGAHAWMARSFNYGSPTSCYDHIATFETSDGGRTWQQSVAIPLNIGVNLLQSPPPCGALACTRPFSVSLSIFFIDANHGWLVAAPSGGNSSDYPQTPRPSLFATTNGGRDWRLVSQSFDLLNCRLTFTSLASAWCGLRRTGDGGVTWSEQRLPSPCPCDADAPVFFTPRRGVIHIRENNGDRLLATNDGGNTWRPLSLPSTSPSLAIDFADASNFWDLVLQPGWIRGDSTPPKDWLYHSADGGATWSLVGRDAPVNYPVSYPLSTPTSLWFVDANHGFIVQPNYSPELLTTSDGGRKWTGVNPRVS
jgi:hypothetical protein